MDMSNLSSLMSMFGGGQKNMDTLAPLMSMMGDGQNNMGMLAQLLPMFMGMQNNTGVQKKEPAMATEVVQIQEKPKVVPNYFLPILDIATSEIIFAMAIILSSN